MNIGIVGAGGIGSYYAGLLSRAGHSVRLIARGEHLEAINTSGLEVRSPSGTFIAKPQATADGAKLAGCTHVIVAVKGYSLDEVGPMLVHAANLGAAIVPLLNGVDIIERLEKLGVPRTSVMGGLVTASIARTAPGVVEQRSVFNRVVLGEVDRVPRERTAQLVAALKETGIDARMSDDIQLDLWKKFAFIVPMGVGCGLARKAAGSVLATERGRTLLFAGAVHEIAELSRTTTSPMSVDDETRIRDELLTLQPTIRPSFLNDLERGGPTELDLLAGAVSRMGQERGVATPIHDVATAAFESSLAG